VDALGLADRVMFLGHRSDVSRVLAAADIHCQPNLLPEPFGIAFVEALYAGLPLVTTALGAATEIVSPMCGILVPPNDVAALAEALHQMIDDGGASRGVGVCGTEPSPGAERSGARAEEA